MSLKAKKAVYDNSVNGIARWTNTMYGSGYFIKDDKLFLLYTNGKTDFICTKEEFLDAGGQE